MLHLFIQYFNKLNILGISCFYHDSAAALITDGKIVSACQEERFTRKKHDSSFPSQAIESVLSQNSLKFKDVDLVVFYDKPFLKFERLIETYLSEAPKGFSSFSMAMPIWLREKLFLKSFLFKQFKNRDNNFKLDQLLFSEHHFSHLASAFYPSPFNESILLTLDGVGEWATTSAAIGRGNKIEIVKEIHFPNSLGLLYSAFTYYAGFKVNSGEYKLMGLAPYGRPIYSDLIEEKIIDIKEDGSFRLDQSYFNYSTGLKMISGKFEKLFKHKPRNPKTDDLNQFHMDIASSIQAVTEKVVQRIADNLFDEFKIPNLCLAGGVALNCVANGKLLKNGKYQHIWIQPAAGDAGGAIGAALGAWYHVFENDRKVINDDGMSGSYLGPEFNDEDIEQQLLEEGANFKRLSDSQLIEETAEEIANKKAVGWFQGRMEFGPRALGNRSIIADPRDPSMQKNLNLKVKFRESFRPFAPAILREDLEEWFEINVDSPYMLVVSQIANSKKISMTEKDQQLFGINKLNVKRSELPSVTHVDYSARIQTVHRETNPRFYELINRFKLITGCPVLINTSFNVRGEPIVCTPRDAFRCFMGTNLDVLTIGNFILRKEDQDSSLNINYKEKYELD